MDVAEVLRETARRLPQKAAILWRDRGMSFGELEQRVHSLAVGLRELKVSAGEKVALLLPNSPEFVVSYLACLRAGAVAVPLETRLKQEEVLSILASGEVSALIASSAFERMISSLRSQASSLHQVILVGEKTGGYASYELLAGQPRAEGLVEKANQEDDALYLYTSGTTGRPKGVIMTYGNLDCFPETMETVFSCGEKEVFAIVLPMSHISGPTLINLMVAKGSTLVILDTIQPEAILEGIERHRVNWFHGVPPIFQTLLKASPSRPYDTNSLRFIAMMGAPVPLSLLRDFQERYPGVAVCQGYGLTESSPLITLISPEAAISKMGSVGRPVPRIDVRILDEAGRSLPPGEVGEVVVRGPQVMKGYYRDAEATALVLREGWLHTGDLGRFDEDGYLFLVGRKREMIITGGLNVFPAEIEELLLRHPQVSEAAVIGIPDFMRGEVIRAVVVLQPGATLSKRELMGYCRQQLADFKVPSQVEIRQSLPRTATGKIAKGELLAARLKAK